MDQGYLHRRLDGLSAAFVEADNHLLAREHALLRERGSPPDHQHIVVRDVVGAERGSKRRTARIVSAHADQATTRAQRPHVDSRVGGATGRVPLVSHVDHRNWRLGGEAERAADEVSVQHDVADDGDREAREGVNRSEEACDHHAAPRAAMGRAGGVTRLSIASAACRRSRATRSGTR